MSSSELVDEVGADRHRAKRLTRHSLNVAALSNRIKRTSIMISEKRHSHIAKKAPDASPPPKGVERGGLGDEEVLQMLADSYREVTGRAMPPTMTAEEAYAELRLRTVAAWQGDLNALSESLRSSEGSPAEKRSSMVDSMRTSARRSRLSLKNAQSVMASTAPSLKDEDWDPEMLEMLKASYREVTGRAMPTGMSAAAAEAELRQHTMMCWQEERRDARNGLWAEMIEEEDEEEGFAATLAPAAACTGGEPPLRAEKSMVQMSVEHDDDDDEEGQQESATGDSGGRAVTIAAMAEAPRNGRGSELPPRPRELVLQKSELFRPRGLTHHSKGSDKVFEGWLTKHKHGMLKQDRMRWFVLHASGEVHYFTGPDLTSHKGMFSVKDLAESDIEQVGFREVAKYCLNVRTPQRLWVFSSDADSQAKAWKKNLLQVIHALQEEPTVS